MSEQLISDQIFSASELTNKSNYLCLNISMSQFLMSNSLALQF